MMQLFLPTETGYRWDFKPLSCWTYYSLNGDKFAELST